MLLYQDDNMREEWDVEVEESEVPQQVKQESEDDNWFESHPEQQSSSNTKFKVRRKHCNVKRFYDSSSPIFAPLSYGYEADLFNPSVNFA